MLFRPGDRIVLEPGTHDVGDVHIPWPLHLVGGGQTADDTVLCCSQSIDGALDFRYFLGLSSILLPFYLST